MMSKYLWIFILLIILKQVIVRFLFREIYFDIHKYKSLKEFRTQSLVSMYKFY